MRNMSPPTSNRKELRCWLWQRAKVDRRGSRRRLASQAFDLSTDGGDNPGRPFIIECAEADKSSHVPPSGETPTRLKLVRMRCRGGWRMGSQQGAAFHY